MKKPVLKCTTDYSKFRNSKENRNLSLQKLRPEHKRLFESMKRYGFDPAFPIKVRPNGSGLVIEDGQHRHAFARELGITFYYVESEVDIDVVELQETQAKWKPEDIAARWAAAGVTDYIEALNFREQFPFLSVTNTFGLLAGTLRYANIARAFKLGKYRIKNEDFAYRVAGLYAGLKRRNPRLQQSFLLAGYACCCLSYFDERRLLHKVDMNPERLIRAGSRDEALQVLEEIYNFNVKNGDKRPLRLDAKSALKARAAVDNGLGATS